MKQSKFSTKQRKNWVKEYLNGKRVHEICIEAGISKRTLYNWKNEFPTLDAEELPPTRIYSDEYAVLHSTVTRFISVEQRVQLARKIIQRHNKPAAIACAIMGIDIDEFDHTPGRDDLADELIIAKIKEFIKTDTNKPIGYWRRQIFEAFPLARQAQIKRIFRDYGIELKVFKNNYKSSVGERYYLPNHEWVLVVRKLVTGNSLWKSQYAVYIFEPNKRLLINYELYSEYSDDRDPYRLLNLCKKMAGENGYPKKIFLSHKDLKKYFQLNTLKNGSVSIPIIGIDLEDDRYELAESVISDRIELYNKRAKWNNKNYNIIDYKEPQD